MLIPKGKAILLTGRGGPYGCETLKLPHFLDRLTESGKRVCGSIDEVAGSTVDEVIGFLN
jgi:hypothetical protein